MVMLFRSVLSILFARVCVYHTSGLPWAAYAAFYGGQGKIQGGWHSILFH